MREYDDDEEKSHESGLDIIGLSFVMGWAIMLLWGGVVHEAHKLGYWLEFNYFIGFLPAWGLSFVIIMAMLVLAFTIALVCKAAIHDR